jgi:hypothetical protein
VSEIGATYHNAAILERLVKAAATWCDGFMLMEAMDVLRVELAAPDAETMIRCHKIAPGSDLMDMLAYVNEPEVRRFYAEGAFGNKGLKTLLPKLDPVLKGTDRSTRLPFPKFVDAYGLKYLGGMLQLLAERGRIKAFPQGTELADFWKRAKANRLSTLMLMANIHRWIGQEGKAAGALSDIRVIIEAAYADRFITRDKELLACGQVVREVEPSPRIELWPF